MLNGYGGSAMKSKLIVLAVSMLIILPVAWYVGSGIAWCMNWYAESYAQFSVAVL